MLMRLLTLRLRAVLPLIDGQRKVDRRELALQPPHDGDRRIRRVGYAEHDLEIRIVLIAERAQALVELVLCAAQGLQYRDGRRTARQRPRPRPPAKPHREHGEHRGQRVDHGGGGERRARPKQPSRVRHHGPAARRVCARIEAGVGDLRAAMIAA